MTITLNGTTGITTPAETLNRAGNGVVATLQKDSVNKGFIGINGNDPYFGRVAGVGITAQNNKIRPADGDDGSGYDNAVDLGEPTYRFKDLYLSGGVYVGGTTAANHLDDYEEGTWTPTTSSLGNISSVTISSAAYTKIGRIVHCRMYGTVTVTSTGTNTYFGFSLPFTADNNATQPSGVGNMAGAQNSTFVVIDWSGGNATQFGVWAQSGNVVNNGTLVIGIGFTYTAS